MKENKQISEQIPLSLPTQNFMSREDFMVSDCNREAFQMVDAWPQWLTSGMVIYGPKGCGKSHLAHIFAAKVMQNSEKPSKVSIVSAAHLTINRVKRLAQENQSIVIEDIDTKVDNEALFHLFNIYNTAGRYMLLTSENAPTRMRFALKDLQSRLNMLPSVAIKEPDDVMLQTLIVKLFNDRQLRISEEVLNYIMNNAQRSFAYIRALVEATDYISLIRKSAINYAVIRAAMDVVEHEKINEPDLFDY